MLRSMRGLPVIGFRAEILMDVSHLIGGHDPLTIVRENGIRRWSQIGLTEPRTPLQKWLSIGLFVADKENSSHACSSK